MPRVNRPSQKLGLPPGTLIHVGGDDNATVRVTAIDYGPETFETREVLTVEECHDLRERNTVTWINVDGIHQVDVVEAIGKAFDIHPLLLEDILNPNQRPKADDFDDYAYVVLKMLSVDREAPSGVQAEQISIVVGRTWVLTFQESPGDLFDPVRQRIRDNKGKVRKLGADYLAYALIDVIVDNYFVILETLGDEVETLEEEVINEPTPRTLGRLHHLRRELVQLRRSVWPLRDALSALYRGESPVFEESTLVYLRDVYDHTIRVGDSVETFRDTIAGLLDVYLSSVSNRMNEVMKVLTVISTLFIPLTFIAGVYGMNFRHMPELDWKWGYEASLILMGICAGVMLLYFRRKKWF